MPLGYHTFLEEIQEYKELHGLVTTDDDYRQRFWLPYLPVDPKEVHRKNRREGWIPPKTEKDDPNTMKHITPMEKPTRVLDKGFILGVGHPVPRYINRGSPVAKEFQGARIRINSKIGPAVPEHIPLDTRNYIIRRHSPLHHDCVDVDKNSATLWRDLIDVALDNKVISRRPQWYHPLVSTAKERFDNRWPIEKKMKYPESYFVEYCKLFHTPSRVLVLDWIDEQLVFPRVDHKANKKLSDAQRMVRIWDFT